MSRWRPSEHWYEHRPGGRRARWWLRWMPWRARHATVGWHAAPAGLYEMGHGWVRRHDWTEVGEPVTGDGWLEVHCAGDTRRFEGRPADVAALADDIQECRTRYGAEPTVLAPAQIAAWLGLEPGESLVVTWPWPRRLGRAMLLLMVVLFAPAASFGWPSLLHAHNLIVAAFVLLYFGAYRGWTDRVVVSATGLRHCGQHYRWADIEGVGRGFGPLVLWTARGGIPLAGPHAARVMDAAGQITGARNAGAVLPRMTDIPDAALSRAESVDVSAERGLSRTDTP